MKNYIAMNRFKIALGRESDFEGIWKNRETFFGRCCWIPKIQPFERSS
jgi:hypothetical protein